MGPGFESQRDHKAPTKVGAFFMRKGERGIEHYYSTTSAINIKIKKATAI